MNELIGCLAVGDFSLLHFCLLVCIVQCHINTIHKRLDLRSDYVTREKHSEDVTVFDFNMITFLQSDERFVM